MCGIAALLLARGSDAACACAAAGVSGAWRGLLSRRGPDTSGEFRDERDGARVALVCSVLGLCGPELVAQPLVDGAGNALVFNGELFAARGLAPAADGLAPGAGGLGLGLALAADGLALATVGLALAADGLTLAADGLGRAPGSSALAPGSSDTKFLGAVLAAAAPRGAVAVAAALGALSGPWAFAFWHGASGTLFWGRDPVGRRSLLLGRGRRGGGWLALGSVAPPGARLCGACEWSEVSPLGVYWARAGQDEDEDYGSPRVAPFAPRPLPAAAPSSRPPVALRAAAEALLCRLSEAVRVRVNAWHNRGGARVCVLFSGGLDCTVLACLADRHLPAGQGVDLLSVCFAAPRHDSPDRVTALASWRELRRLCPARPWNLYLVDSSLDEVRAAESALLDLVFPCSSQMDVNIAAALWLAARGHGRIAREPLELELEADVAGAARAPIAPGEPALLLSPREPGPGAQGKPGPAPHGSVLETLEREAPCAALPRPTCASAACACALQLGNCKGDPHRKCSYGACAKCCRKHLVAQPHQACRAHRPKPCKATCFKDDDDGAGSNANANPIPNANANAHENDEEGDEQQQQQQQHTKMGVKAVALGSPCDSGARIVLSGLGADEQLGGYARHRVAWSRGGWPALRAEMRADVERLWQRNLGRDDRCVSDWGRELRLPYLDEGVVELLGQLPVETLTDPRLPLGVGDKRLLRLVAAILGLDGAALLPKRAIQFGSRIAQHARAMAEGSRRTLKGDAPYSATC
jgi:asparagine synthetase B (glutamine-hydrolysing)